MTRELAKTGNPSSLHGAGRRARRAVEDARETLAAAAGAHPSEVIFTSGGTEADNLAVKGLYWARRDENRRRTRILCSAVEHHAVMDTVEWLERHEGADVTWLPVDSEGAVRLDVVQKEISRDPESVALVTVMWANNEVGTIQPVADIVELARPHGIPVHSDAVQAFGSVPVDFRASGLSAMSVSGHKLGGPVGVGALFLGRAVKLTPVQHGEGRSGTYARVLWTHPRSPLSPLQQKPSPQSCRRSGNDWRRCVTISSGESLKLFQTPCSVAPRVSAGFPATPTSPSLAAKAIHCCSCLTWQALSPQRVRRARPECRGPRTSCSRWDWTRTPPVVPSASRLDTRPLKLMLKPF